MRYVMLDRIIAFEAGKTVTAVKNITLESSYFDHHFPGVPVFPGALMIEVFAQASGYLVIRSAREQEGRIWAAMLAGVERARFFGPARPGDQLIVTATLTRHEAAAATTLVTATVASRLIARASVVLAITDAERRPELAQAVAQFDRLRADLESDAAFDPPTT